jgi:hypothetical protein
VVRRWVDARMKLQPMVEHLQHMTGVRSVTESALSKKGKDAPNLNQLSNFDVLDGRLGGLWGEGRRGGHSSFLGVDQGAIGRPKSGLERRFSLVWVGCGPDAKSGTGGGGMRGSYVTNGSATPMPESLM